ncbi:MAG: helix-turn-helix transcriptional regulator [Anaerovoracaceae bacterium]|jgi:predicted DNA-binding transcriptional regulator YafY
MGDNVMKRRLLLLQNLIYDQTDEDHQISTFEILDYLEKEGIPTNRKTLKNNLDLLSDMGMDIVTVAGKPNRYFIGDREFELPELKLLLDAVSSSRFITQKKSKQLAEKLTALASNSQKEELKRHIYAASRVKPRNENIYYTVDRINDAISKKRKISFQYTEYTGEKKKVLRNEGEVYVISPYALFWNDDFYYVVGHSLKRNNISAFRVDRLHEPEVLDEEAVPATSEFNIDDYSKRIFEMFDGETVRVRLECENSLMKYIIDRFGEGVETMVNSEKTFIAGVDVALSPIFYGWIFQFCGGIRILTPKRAVDEMMEMVEVWCK